MTPNDMTGVSDIPALESDTSGGQVTMSPAQAARFLGVTERTVRRQAANEKLPEGWAVAAGADVLTLICLDRRRLNDSSGHESPPKAPDVTPESDTSRADMERLEAEVERLRAEKAGVEQLLADAREREAWLRSTIDRMLLPAAPEPVQVVQTRRPWWARLTNRGRS